MTEKLSGAGNGPVRAGGNGALSGRSIPGSDSIISAAAFGLVLVIWEGAVRVLHVPDFILPAPTAIAMSLYYGLKSGLFVQHFYVTALQTILGFFLAALFGIGLGALIAQFRIVERTIYPWLIALQALPKIAIAPLIIVWAGYGIESKIVIVALVALFPILVNTIVGLKSCDQGKLDLMSSLGASGWETFRLVRLPNALPFIFAGLNVAIVLAILGSIVGEFVGSKAGLGNLILEANFQFNVAQMFAILVILGLFGVALSMAVRFVQSRLMFWNAGFSQSI
ncbi:ABC transporter permease [Bradyrhizobium canariense]|uniref:NitT/TauT family transport system permease protein n=1 Tax=Bradyrhizobium canariense TaxID=255045 RepID=A0A1H1XNG5_9BRAD|nr:ABC transporter permease [Bradyrhizobium canariense]SDT10601.1 NitT/TauT family transport system permease protein [Bradyrhizobium canariense]